MLEIEGSDVEVIVSFFPVASGVIVIPLPCSNVRVSVLPLAEKLVLPTVMVLKIF